MYSDDEIIAIALDKADRNKVTIMHNNETTVEVTYPLPKDDLGLWHQMAYKVTFKSVFENGKYRWSQGEIIDRRMQLLVNR